jgi:hypothetical protein
MTVTGPELSLRIHFLWRKTGMHTAESKGAVDLRSRIEFADVSLISSQILALRPQTGGINVPVPVFWL